MSHVTTIDLKINDLDALAIAADRLGMELVRGVKTYKWFGRFVGDYNDAAIKEMGIDPKDHGKCDHVLRVKGAGSDTYEIGVVKVGDDYRLLYDFWAGGNGLMEKVSSVGKHGKDCNKLRQEYATEVARKQLRKQGYRVREVRQDGRVKLVASK